MPDKNVNQRVTTLLLIAATISILLTPTITGREMVYVVNSYVHGTSPDWSSVMMLRGSDLAIQKTQKVGDNAHSLALSPDKKQVWVTCPGSNNIKVLDAASLKVLKTIDLGPKLTSPMGIAFKPEIIRPVSSKGVAYITFEGTGRIGIVDGKTYSLSGTINVGGLPNSIVFTPKGNKAYVIDYQNAIVTYIRTSDNHILGSHVFGGHALQDGVISPDGAWLYISNMELNQIEIIRTRDDTVLAPIRTTDIKPRAIGISPDGNYLFIGHYKGVDAVINMMRLSDRTIVSSASIPSNPRCMAVRTDGSRIFVTEHNDDEVYAFDVVGETLIPAASRDLNTVAGYYASPVGIAIGDVSMLIPISEVSLPKQIK